MDVVMRYGKEGLPVTLPEDCEATVITKKAMPVLPEPREALKGAFAEPLGCRPLEEEARGQKSASILICDVTRPVPNGTVLPVLIDTLAGAGIRRSSITILVATGLHRPNEGMELEGVLGGADVGRGCVVVNHFARAGEDHRYLGTTPAGMPVKIDRRFVDADLRIVVGLVEPHFMAGYSGGRKVMVPGAAHEDTIRWLHSTKRLCHPKATNCVIEGNPFHEAMVAAVGMTGKVYAVNTVIDEARRISCVTFGECIESHLAAIAFARPYFEIPLPRRFRTVLTSAAGYPLDGNFYQTVKAMSAATGALQEGGRLFVVSSCSGGLGSREFADSQARMIQRGLDAFFRETMEKEYAAIDEWESIMQAMVMKTASVHLFTTGLSEKERALTGIPVIGSVRESIEKSMREQNDRAVAVIPEGPYVIPFCVPQAIA